MLLHTKADSQSAAATKTPAQTTAITQFIALTQKGASDTGINRQLIGRFHLNAQGDIEIIAATILTKDLKGTESWDLRKGGLQRMLFIGIAIEVIFVGNSETGDHPSRTRNLNRRLKRQPDAINQRIGTMGSHCKIQ